MLFYIALTTITVLFAGLVCSKRMPSRFLTGGEQMALPQQASRLTRQSGVNLDFPAFVWRFCFSYRYRK